MNAPRACFAVLYVLSALASGTLLAEDYPLRAKYPQETFVTTAELASSAQAIIVDVRDQTEYDVLHIDGARLLPVETLKLEELQALRPAGDTRRIIFYCNGVTCEKSYKAASKAAFWEVPNTAVYDAGIFAWAQAHPERSRFFDGVLSPETIRSALIPAASFEAACLEPAAFRAQAADPAYRVYDIREKSDRIAHPMTFSNDVRLTLDGFVAALGKGEIPKSKLLLYDNVGKQVVWLQYYLEKHGIKDYAFLKGGVRAVK